MRTQWVVHIPGLTFDGDFGDTCANVGTIVHQIIYGLTFDGDLGDTCANVGTIVHQIIYVIEKKDVYGGAGSWRRRPLFGQCLMEVAVRVSDVFLGHV